MISGFFERVIFGNAEWNNNFCVDWLWVMLEKCKWLQDMSLFLLRGLRAAVVDLT
jgi:hypothetical protein